MKQHLSEKGISFLYGGLYLVCCIGLVFAGLLGFRDTSHGTSEKNHVASEHSTKTASGSSIHDTGNSSGLMKEEVDLCGHTPTEFCYNEVDNSLSMIEEKNKKFSLYQLSENGTWKHTATWKCKKNQTLSLFTYGSDGTLYGCLKTYRKKCFASQQLVRLKKDSMKTVSLKKIGSKEICDLQFAGTSLALTFSDRSVKFYNINEKMALGDTHIRGASGQNLLYDKHYLTIHKDDNSGQLLLTEYDIQIGDSLRSFALGKATENRDEAYLSHYHGTLYLLTSSGLFAGNFKDSSLTKQCSFPEPDFSSEQKISYFQAARDQTLFYAWNDGTMHLIRGVLVEKEKDSVEILEKL